MRRRWRPRATSLQRNRSELKTTARVAHTHTLIILLFCTPSYIKVSKEKEEETETEAKTLNKYRKTSNTQQAHLKPLHACKLHRILLLAYSIRRDAILVS